MSHTEPGPLAAYNSLQDPHLTGYFNNTRMRKHLKKSGLVNRQGEIITEQTYRLNMARREHKRHVRELLAQAIVHKTLDMERARQVEIKKKLEEISKIERVQRIRTERGRHGDEDIIPYLSPRGSRPHSAEDYPNPRAYTNGTRPKTAPQFPKGHRRRRQDGPPMYFDEEGMPLLPPQARRAEEPRESVDSHYLYQVDPAALRTFTNNMGNMDLGGGVSPYTLPVVDPTMLETGSPHPTPRKPASSRRRTRSGGNGSSGGSTYRGRRLKPPSNKGSLTLHRMEPPKAHRTQLQSMCEVTMRYVGKNIHLDVERFDYRDEIMVEQQHCGGNTLVVFRELLHEGTSFSFISRRHRGFPFSLTFYLNGLQDIRLSACCEYKHKKGRKLGSKLGHFELVNIEGAAPCYRCQAAEGVPPATSSS
ncbi:glutamate-rich protein 3-like [Branchiostoma floridae x Branchiostoma japonicum]